MPACDPPTPPDRVLDARPPCGRIRVVLAEACALWADALTFRLGRDPRVEVVGRATSASGAVALIRDVAPDVALVDLALGGTDGGLAVARRTRAVTSPTRCLILAGEPNAWARDEARLVGCVGFVLKADLREGSGILVATRRAARGEPVYWSTDDHPAVDGPHDPRHPTAGELELIRCFARGLDNREIAAHLHVTRQTIRNRTAQIGRKLGVSGRLAIVAHAGAHGLLDAQPVTA